jgi:GNAT superfamily N-acetyltransferase
MPQDAESTVEKGASPMDVRALTAADAAEFRHIRLEMLRLHPTAYGSTLANWQDLPESAYAARIEDGVIFGLWTDAGLQGTLAYDREKGGNARHRAGIHAVYVRDAMRGRGGIDSLIAAAVDLAGNDGVTQLEMAVVETNERALGAYLRNGFVRFAVTPRAVLYDGRHLDEVHLMRRLDL